MSGIKEFESLHRAQAALWRQVPSHPVQCVKVSEYHWSNNFSLLGRDCFVIQASRALAYQLNSKDKFLSMLCAITSSAGLT